MNMGSASRKCSNRLDTEGKKRNWKKKKKTHTQKVLPLPNSGALDMHSHLWASVSSFYPIDTSRYFIGLLKIKCTNICKALGAMPRTY